MLQPGSLVANDDDPDGNGTSCISETICLFGEGGIEICYVYTMCSSSS